jgi:ligand-binding SRPBCC domain-containing protein
MRLRFQVSVPVDLATVFKFHEDPAHLALLLKGRESFRLLRHDGSIAPGSMTWVQETIATLVPVTMGFRHTLLEPPRGFTEEMVHGPFERFVHVHQFAESKKGTEVIDILELSLPWHYGGELVTRRFVAPVIQKVFEHRHAALRRVLCASAAEMVW